MSATILYICVLLAFARADHVHEMEILETNAASKFSWSLCNTSAVPFVVKELNVLPDPIQFGQELTFNLSLDVLKDIGTTSTLQADLKVMLNMGTEVYDLCNYSPDYCHLKDVCSKLTSYVPFCPEILVKQGLNCRCPFKKSSYAVKNAVVKLPTPRLSVAGEFDITIDMKESGAQVSCLHIHLCIGQC